MAECGEQLKPKEREIPVFTVLKNNCILKNIFLLDNPPPISSSSSLFVAENVDQESEIEEVLLVGRHPDCNIKLEHPSISRFHLRIHSKTSSRSLFVTDLSSVHGTWVSGRRIEPGVRTKVNEGDTLHLGASSRLYRLNWIPISRAYDTDDPFVPQMDASDTVDEENERVIDQDGHSLSYGNNQEQGLSDNVEGSEGLLSTEYTGLSMQKTSPIAPPTTEESYDPVSYKDEVENNLFSEKRNKENELSNSQLHRLDASFSVDKELEGVMDKDGDSSPCRNDRGQRLSMQSPQPLFSDELLVLSMQEMSAAAPPMPEDSYHSFPDKDVVENNHSPETCNKENELSSSQPHQLDASFAVDEEIEGVMDQDVESLPCTNDQGQRLSDNIQSSEQLFSDELLALSMGKMSETAPPLPEDSYHSFPDKDEVENNHSPEICNKENELSTSQLHQLDASFTVDEETEGVIDQDGDSLPRRNDRGQGLSDNIGGLEELFSDELQVSSLQEMSSTAPPMPEDLHHSFSEKEVEKHSPEICNKENQLFSSHLCQAEKENGTPQAHSPSAGSRADTTEHSAMNSEKRPGLNIWWRRGISKSVKVDTSRSRGDCARINRTSQVKSLLDENCSSESMLKDQCASPDNDDEIFTPDKENTSPNSYLVRSLKCKFEETLKGESISNTPISSVDQDDEIFTPDKENKTPSSHLLRSKKNTERSGEVKHPNSHRPSPLKIVNNSNMYQEEVLLPTFDRACQHQKVLQGSKSIFCVSENHGSLKKQPPVLTARADREPFRLLPMNSSSEHQADSIPSVHKSTMIGCRYKHPESEYVNHSHKNIMKMSKNRWTIVADTACLLNRKSRKELQLLRGLRGTTLVIPRIVVRELDCMLKRASFFSRMTEASAALNWIEECMAATKWWIHVQSSAEESRLVPPTPPAAASPHWFSEDKSTFSVGSIPFSPYNLQEIVTPTAADHILECALFFKRTTNGQLVLLSDDVALKIRAMAEGVICETTEEFRRSLVNPFSPRFLYTSSSPVGPTWSCVDDTELKKKYYPSPTKTTSKSGEGAKGLKLILLHNSSFRQMKTSEFV